MPCMLVVGPNSFGHRATGAKKECEEMCSYTVREMGSILLLGKAQLYTSDFLRENETVKSSSAEANSLAVR